MLQKEKNCMLFKLHLPIYKISICGFQILGVTPAEEKDAILIEKPASETHLIVKQVKVWLLEIYSDIVSMMLSLLQHWIKKNCRVSHAKIKSPNVTLPPLKKMRLSMFQKEYDLMISVDRCCHLSQSTSCP